MTADGAKPACEEALTAPIAVTPGDPAGIGPDLLLFLAHAGLEGPVVAIADPDMLAARARALELPITLAQTPAGPPWSSPAPGTLWVHPLPLAKPCEPGVPDPTNASSLLAALDTAVDGCLGGSFSALVTGPLSKAIINESGVPFTGHTEYLAARCGGAHPVMLLAGGGLRVALATTHLPLRAVAGAIQQSRIERVLRILHADLRGRFAVDAPRIAVLGLNPHAGENGHLGDEEITVIGPVIRRLQAEGMRLTGPLPADTAFTPERLARCDAVLAMYHDQGLPVLKHASFGLAVNVTLGLPIIRTSVDHGTAFDLAGTGRADAGSLRAAIASAAAMACAAGG